MNGTGRQLRDNLVAITSLVVPDGDALANTAATLSPSACVRISSGES